MKKVAIISILCMFIFSSVVSADTVSYGEELTNEPSVNYQQKFSDVPKDYWAFGYIAELVNKGVISGYPDGTFKPDKEVTRAEFAKIMIGAAGLKVTAVNTSSFADVAVTDWCCPYIETAKDFLNGYDYNGKSVYLPDTAAVREDIAIAIVKLKGYDTSVADLGMLKTMFSDYDSISDSAKKYVAVAVEKGLVSGYEDGTFRAQKPITRAEAASMLWRASQYGNDNKVITGDDTSNASTASTTSSTTTTSTTDTTTTSDDSTAVETKPYKIDTIAKADISTGEYIDFPRAYEGYTDYSDYMTNDGNSIYCYEKNSCIYKIDISSGKKEKEIDVKEWFDDHKNSNDQDDQDLYNHEWYFLQIYYSKSQNSIYVLTSVQDVGKCLFSLSGDSLSLVGKNVDYVKMFCDMSDGQILLLGDDNSNYSVYTNLGYVHIVDLSTDQTTQLSLTSGIKSAISKDGKIYYCCSGIYSYDFDNAEKILDVIGDDECYFGNEFIYKLDTSDFKINKYTYTGSEKTSINFSDIEVKDSTALSGQNIACFFVLSNENIVIYDKNAGAFRLISKNA